MFKWLLAKQVDIPSLIVFLVALVITFIPMDIILDYFFGKPSKTQRKTYQEMESSFDNVRRRKWDQGGADIIWSYFVIL